MDLCLPMRSAVPTAPTRTPGNPKVTRGMKNQLTPLRFVERAAAVHPNRTAIVDGTRTLTYAAMAAQVTRLAHSLRAKGLAAGDRVAYLAANSAEVLIAHFAVPLAGGVLVTINTRLSAEEIGYIVDHSGARFLVADADLLAPALATVRQIGALQEIFALPAENSGSAAEFTAGEAHTVSVTGYFDLLGAGNDDPIDHQ